MTDAPQQFRALVADKDGDDVRRSLTDLSGEVIASDGGDVAPGDQVIVHGYDLGVAHHGGFAEVARVPADWVVPLPEGLSARQAMALGTAGYTAALSVIRLEDHGVQAGD